MSDQTGYRVKSVLAIQFIQRYQQAHGASPTVREIAEAVGYASPGAAHRMLRRMEEDGLIETSGMHSPRNIAIPNRDRKVEL